MIRSHRALLALIIPVYIAMVLMISVTFRVMHDLWRDVCDDGASGVAQAIAV